ncbi:AbgT family transporter [Taylorella equigenitalis]|uniref:Aminobenzoyl-glutamate transporter family protein n=1 Tax=Taylorella equigenitalis ATCC 35865 TaxID=743973 RepID=A0ABM5NA72_9BURK|nr:AbgT family transporter [Taylorella equigenitalis]AFN35766.1 aminobenzoyl-glutamate transporter family protein [Taylorella equigenitalis ATCC 35865]ASY39181.1 p-aminobenzoyl-glutamate transporter [Taylorella equigenitalis]WDU47004.1 AbgT family transporter [Taylorella equigenitalis]WDU52470.1 AbgT family transporter [Taylorella equigenitalis]WDU55469.1 AbgT family transporter [Taylorella equigenitalis]
MNKFLNFIERTGNKLPHPFFLFVYLSIFVIITTAFMAQMDASAVNPKTNAVVAIKSLLSDSGIQFMFTSMVENFVKFPPLGIIIIAMFGFGLADRVGLLPILIHSIFSCVPKRLLTFTVFVIGISSNIAPDANIILVPLVAMIYHSLGRHPIAGAAAAYGASGAGYDVSVLITTSDIGFAGITTEASRFIDPNFYVSPIDNYFFAVSSVVLLAIIGTILIDKFIEPRLNRTLKIDSNIHITPVIALSDLEKKGLRKTMWAALIYIAIMVAILLPSTSPLRNPDGGLVPSPFLKSFVPILFGFFMTVGITFGRTVGRIKKSADIPALMVDAVKEMAVTLVLFFIIAQFIAYFKWSNLGQYIAIQGSIFLEEAGFTGFSMMIAFILMSALLNIFISSGSAQWSLMAPIFVPMLMLVDYHPAFTLAMYKIGDSSTNIISPMSPYFSVCLVYMQRYKKDLGMGSLLSIMLPITIAFLFFWTILILAWVGLGWELGPGILPHL